jgi:hypothetical protein
VKTAPTPIITAVLGFCSAALLIPQPVQPQSFHPELAGPLFCQLRSRGIPRDAATAAAIGTAWDNNRPDTKVHWRGEVEDSDVIGMLTYVQSNCPQYQ